MATTTKSYTSTTEYRILFRQLCNMDTKIMYKDEWVDISQVPLEEIDEETLDEFQYDEAAVTQYLDKVYEETKGDAAFRQLYSVAAGLMMSEDHQIGLAVLMSYDYLGLFQICLQNKRESSARFQQSYNELINALKPMRERK